ncbi:MAG: LysR family transcriptional regulator [Pseudomonadota bacterium]
MNRFAEIEAFVAVVDTGSMSAAAQRLGIAVSAVSRRIGELESRLGVRLANRSTRGFSPTPLGMKYFEKCQCIIADFAEADSLVIDEEAVTSGPLKIAAPLSFGINHLSPVFNAFAKAHPGIRFDLDFSDRRVDLVDDGFDLAIRIDSLEDSGLIARKLFDIQHLVTASPDYWKRNGFPRHPNDLSSHTALVYRTGTSPTKWPYLDPGGKPGTVQVEPRFITKNGDLLVKAAQSGLGVTLEPSFVCAHAIASGSLVPALTKYSWYGMSAYVVYPPGRPLPKRARAFVDALVSSFFGQPEWDRAIAHLIDV